MALLRTTSPAPAADAKTPLTQVTLADFMEAMRPLFTLIGVDPAATFADGFTIVTDDRIEYVSVTPVAGIDPIEVGEDFGSVWGWPVVVEVVR